MMQDAEQQPSHALCMALTGLTLALDLLTILRHSREHTPPLVPLVVEEI